ncbi:MAG: GGDEF domain-containing protein, partial [Planifilum fulgidum]
MVVWDLPDRLDALTIPLQAMTDPLARWAVFGGVLLFLILWLLFRKLPPFLYLAGALCALILLRALFTDGWLLLLWVFLLTQAVVSFRFTRECTFLVTAMMFVVYQGTPWMDEVLAGSFHFGLIYENFPGIIEVGLYFFLNACLIRTLRKVRKENFQLKRENRQLIERVNEAHRSLHEYIVQLEEMSRRDYLTGLYNFSGFQEQLTRSLARCAPDQSYHVICIDLVDFQQINLQEGTDAGDQILFTIARRLKRSLPSYAQVARYEGDQFAVGLIGDDGDLRHALEAIESVFSELREERSFIHFCWATASYPREAQSAAELLRLAEHRLSIEQRRIRHEEEERQRHLEKLSAIGQLSAGLAHEIR